MKRPALALPRARAPRRRRSRRRPSVPPVPKEFVTDKAGVLSPGTRRALEEPPQGLRGGDVEPVPRLHRSRASPTGRRSRSTPSRRPARGGRARQGPEQRPRPLRLPGVAVRPASRSATGSKGALPDALAGRILRDEAIPRFRAGDWDGGVTAAVDGAIAATKGEYEGTGRRTASRRGKRLPVLARPPRPLPRPPDGLRRPRGRRRPARPVLVHRRRRRGAGVAGAVADSAEAGASPGVAAPSAAAARAGAGEEGHGETIGGEGVLRGSRPAGDRRGDPAGRGEGARRDPGPPPSRPCRRTPGRRRKRRFSSSG